MCRMDILPYHQQLEAIPVQGIVLAVGVVVFLQIIRTFLSKSPLATIPGPAKGSLIYGNSKQLFNREAWNFHANIAKVYGGLAKTYGLLGKEQLFVTDPLALHHIVIKDEPIYEETDVNNVETKLVFGPSVISTFGEQHRKQRKLLSPVFSTKHMRDLVPIFYPIVYKLKEVLDKQIKCNKGEVDVARWMSRAALEYIGQGGLGYSFDALDDTKQNEYNEAANMLLPVFSQMETFRQMFPYVTKIGTPDFRRKLLKLIPIGIIQKAREIVDILHGNSVHVLEAKKEALKQGDEAVVEQIGKGKDIMSILLRENKKAASDERLTETEVLAQMNLLIFAGHDTTSMSISRVLYLLSLHKDVQAKLREEVTAARKLHGDLDYETLMGLPYLDAICRETLRLYAPVSYLTRVARADTVLPLMWPIKSVDGKSEIKEVSIKKNTTLILSIFNANRHPAVWGDDAEEWKPERWLKPLPDSVAKAHLPSVYSSMMTFIGGTRSCIGFKFAELELKLVLSVLLESYTFEPSGKEIYWNMTPVQTPVVPESDELTPSLPIKMGIVTH